jgi:hypothetical protein
VARAAGIAELGRQCLSAGRVPEGPAGRGRRRARVPVADVQGVHRAGGTIGRRGRAACPARGVHPATRSAGTTPSSTTACSWR